MPLGREDSPTYAVSISNGKLVIGVGRKRTRSVDLVKEDEDFSRRLEALEKQSEVFSQEFQRVLEWLSSLDGSLKDISNSLAKQDHKESYSIKMIEGLRGELHSIRSDMYSFFIIDSMGLSHSRVRETRYIPVRVYVSEDDEKAIAAIRSAASSFGNELGFVTATSFKPERGSWFQKWIAKSREALTSQETEDVLKKGKRALELAAVHKKQAEVNRENAEAASAFIKAIENTPNAVAQFGSLLIVKLTDNNGRCSVFTRDLSIKEMEYIESNPELTRNPQIILEKLSKLQLSEDTSISVEHNNAPDAEA